MHLPDEIVASLRIIAFVSRYVVDLRPSCRVAHQIRSPPGQGLTACDADDTQDMLSWIAEDVLFDWTVTRESPMTRPQQPDTK
jgi:hypothetical protein